MNEWASKTSKLAEKMEKDMSKAIKSLSPEDKRKYDEILKNTDIAGKYEALRLKNNELIEAIKRAQ